MTPENTDVRPHAGRRRAGLLAGAALAVTGCAALPALASTRDDAPEPPAAAATAAAPTSTTTAPPAAAVVPPAPDPVAEFAARWSAATPEEQLAFRLFTATPDELAAFKAFVTPPPPPQPAATAKVTTRQAPKPAAGRQPARVSGGSGGGGGGGFLGCVRGRESRGNYGAVNGRSGAAGAYQFMPQTWNNTARHAGRSDLVGVNPASASAADQDAMAQHLYSWQGSAPWGGGC